MLCCCRLFSSVVCYRTRSDAAGILHPAKEGQHDTAAARVRRTAINVVDFSDVTTYQNIVDVSDVTTCQNKHARVFCVCDVTE